MNECFVVGLVNEVENRKREDCGIIDMVLVEVYSCGAI